jgi:hypothetical protein
MGLKKQGVLYLAPIVWTVNHHFLVLVGSVESRGLAQTYIFNELARGLFACLRNPTLNNTKTAENLRRLEDTWEL